jgi:hypothetical protein
MAKYGATFLTGTIMETRELVITMVYVKTDPSHGRNDLGAVFKDADSLLPSLLPDLDVRFRR